MLEQKIECLVDAIHKQTHAIQRLVETNMLLIQAIANDGDEGESAEVFTSLSQRPRAEQDS